MLRSETEYSNVQIYQFYYLIIIYNPVMLFLYLQLCPSSTTLKKSFYIKKKIKTTYYIDIPFVKSMAIIK